MSIRLTILLLSLLACRCTQTLAAEDPATLEAKGAMALKLSQSEGDAIISAAIYYGKAAANFEKVGNESKATEMNSFLYWCKKKMTLKQMDAFLKGGDAAVAAATRMKELEKSAPTAADAKKYFDRAEAYAKANPDEHLLIAIRFFEVADRFKGSDISFQAQDRSLQEMTYAGQSNSPRTIKDTTDTTQPAVAAPTTHVPPPLSPAEKKFAVPGAALQQEAKKLIREVFHDDFVKATPADKLALSAKLLAQTSETKDDIAGRYMLLVDAANLASEAADIDALLAAADKLAAEFEGDFTALRKKHLDTIAANTRDQTRSKLAIAYRMLLDKPDDMAANLTVGKHELFEKHDFERALPLLAKSGHAVLSRLSIQDLARPEQATAQRDLGDEWWDAAKVLDKEERACYLERAAFWYSKALPSLIGLNKIKIEKRIEVAGQAKAVLKTPTSAKPGQ